MEVSKEFKQRIFDAVIAARSNFGESDARFAKMLGINHSVYSRLKSGQIDGLLSDSKWLELGRKYEVKLREEAWKIARTSVYEELEGSLLFCKESSKSMIMVDDCDIGKTVCSKHIARGLKNAFYFDCSQAKSKQVFIRELAKTIGLDNDGRYVDVKANLKYSLGNMEKPLVILDEAGDLEYTAFLELKELWNATTGYCGWYMLGADGLQAKVEKGIRNKKVGYREIFSRFSDEFIKITPNGVDDRMHFYRQLIGDVANANLSDPAMVNSYVKICLTKEKRLRHLETLIKFSA